MASDLAFCPESTEDKAQANTPLRKLFFQSAMVTAGNPKAIIFFTAVFPQFIHPQKGYLVQCSLLLAMMAVIAFVCFMLYALGGQKIVSIFSRASVGKWIKRVIGTSFIGAGIGLAASNR